MVAQPLSVAETGDRARGCCYAPEPPRWHKIIASFIPGNDLIAGSTPDIGASIKGKEETWSISRGRIFAVFSPSKIIAG